MMWIPKTIKRRIPLAWKVGFHRYKTVPIDLMARLGNRLRGGLPIPPGKLIDLVSGSRSPRPFLKGGRTASEAIQETLRRSGHDIGRFGTVLDFGCGAGRIMRFWSGLEGPVFHGTDYNRTLLEWCRRNLPFARYDVNSLAGTLGYETESFDFIYAFSVFTHLGETLQLHWMRELSRILRPGGFLYLTTHGDYYLAALRPEEQEQFRNGRLVIRGVEQAGSNFCNAYHPPRYVRQTLAPELAEVEFVSRGARGGSMHDVWLFRKPLHQPAAE